MATFDEIKEKAKTAAMVIALGSAPAMQAQEAHPNMPEKEAVRLEMKQDAKRADFIRENPETYLKVKEDQGNRLVQQLQMPVADDNKKIAETETAIGPFPGFVIEEELDTDYKKYKSNFKSPKNEIERETRNVQTKEDYNYDNMAFYDPSDKKVHMPKWNVSKEILDILNERIPNSWDLHLMSNNPTAEIAAERHENTHFVHDARGQIDEDSRLYQTADMKVEKDYVTEKTAYTVQCLTLANIWRNCKASGMETIELNGEKRPIGEIMDIVPGLRDSVEKNGFNPAFPEDIGRIARLASEHWDKEYLPGYSSEQFSDVARSGTSSNIVNSIIAAREQQQILKDMTKNLDIGYGTKIDIPDDCVALMMPKKEIIQQITASANSFSPSTDGLLAIDRYLEERGLKNDKDKDQYLKTQFANIVNRSDDADLKLKELMLACCNKDNNMIYYTDKLQVRNQGGIQTVSNDLGKTTYALSRMDERSNFANDQTKGKERAQKEENETKILTPADISRAFYQGR